MKNTPENIVLARQYGVALPENSQELNLNCNANFYWFKGSLGHHLHQEGNEYFLRPVQNKINDLSKWKVTIDEIITAPTTDQLIDAIMRGTAKKQITLEIAPYTSGKQFVKFKDQNKTKTIWLDDKTHLAEALAIILLSL